MDEKPYRLAHARDLIPAAPGRDRREDSEYVRNGTCSIFCGSSPAPAGAGSARSPGAPGSTGPNQVQRLLTMGYPGAERVVLVMDNLNTHDIASLDEAFDPQIAFALAQRLEIHHTPKHGSWLNIAEIELSALTRQCLDRRIERPRRPKHGTGRLAEHRQRRPARSPLALHHRRHPHSPTPPLSQS